MTLQFVPMFVQIHLNIYRAVAATDFLFNRILVNIQISANAHEQIPGS